MKELIAAVLCLMLLAAASPALALGPADVERVTAGELKTRIDSGENIVLLDMRSPGAWRESDVKIEGAVRIAPNELADRLWEIPFGAKIATYCT